MGSDNPTQWLNDTKDMDLKQLFNYIEVTKAKTINNLGHEFMSDNIGRMVLALRDAIDPYNLKNLGDDAYKGLFFQGLEYTKYYQTEVLDKGLKPYYNTLSSNVCNISIPCN